MLAAVGPGPVHESIFRVVTPLFIRHTHHSYKEVGAGVLRRLDLDEEESLPAELTRGRKIL